MLKANELRIGNYVHLDSLTDGTSIDLECKLFHLEEINRSIKYRYSPVELTEEWLIKFGFKWKNHGLRKSSFCIRQYGGGWSIFMSNESFNFNIELKYVHQLQNIYFALTGVELELSSNVA